MSDLPVEGTVLNKKEVPLTLEERVVLIESDIRELARGVNLQGALLERIVLSSDHIVKKYLELTAKPEPKEGNGDAPKE